MVNVKQEHLLIMIFRVVIIVPRRKLGFRPLYLVNRSRSSLTLRDIFHIWVPFQEVKYVEYEPGILSINVINKI